MSAEPRYMLDTNICIYIQRRQPLSVFERFGRTPRGQTVISTITWGELYHGAMKSQRRTLVLNNLDGFISYVPIVPMHPDCGQHYGEIRSDLEKRGLTISENDFWIAAHALALNLTLITNNTREFERIPNLKIENWVS